MLYSGEHADIKEAVEAAVNGGHAEQPARPVRGRGGGPARTCARREPAVARTCARPGGADLRVRREPVRREPRTWRPTTGVGDEATLVGSASGRRKSARLGRATISCWCFGAVMPACASAPAARSRLRGVFLGATGLTGTARAIGQISTPSTTSSDGVCQAPAERPGGGKAVNGRLQVALLLAALFAATQ